MATTNEIADSVLGIKTRFDQVINAGGWNRTWPLQQIFGGFTPVISTETIGNYAETIATRIKNLSIDDLVKDDLGTFLAAVPNQANLVNFNNFQQNPAGSIGVFMTLLQAISWRLPPEPLPRPDVDWEQIKDKDLLPKNLARRLRWVEAKLKELEPRSAEVAQKIDEIEAAHATAEQLPTDMQDLASQREVLKDIVAQSGDLGGKIRALSENADRNIASITKAQAHADQLVKRSEEALRGATGVGLAAAFEKRKNNLTIAGIAWTVGLAAALIAALWIGADRVASLKDVLMSDRPATVIWVNALLAAAGVGAPVWFAWLSTKQIWTNFRLAEDYAFKASVSRAYEGYRAEAVALDPALQNRLFAAALTRLEEAPIRLLDMETHGSPLQELLHNPAITKALEGVPDIAEKILALLPGKCAVVAAAVAPAIALATAKNLANDTSEEDNRGEAQAG